MAVLELASDEADSPPNRFLLWQVTTFSMKYEWSPQHGGWNLHLLFNFVVDWRVPCWIKAKAGESWLTMLMISYTNVKVCQVAGWLETV